MSSQGRYAVDGAALVAMNPDDALAKELASRGLADLTTGIRKVASGVTP